MEAFYAIFKTDQPEIEKLTRSFDLITRQIIHFSQGQIELLRAMNDQEGLLKEQVKLSTTEHCRKVFAQCHLMATGRKAWHEEA